MKRSLIWNHFKKIGNDRAKCDICSVIFSYKCGSTSNLKRHMIKKHPDIEYTKLWKRNEKSDDDALSTSHPTPPLPPPPQLVARQKKIKISETDQKYEIAYDVTDGEGRQLPARQKKLRISETDQQYERAYEVTEGEGKQLKRTQLAFGTHVNEKLMSYSEFVRNQVEYQISTILYEADMGFYDKPLSQTGNSNTTLRQFFSESQLVPSPPPSSHTKVVNEVEVIHENIPTAE